MKGPIRDVDAQRARWAAYRQHQGLVEQSGEGFGKGGLGGLVEDLDVRLLVLPADPQADVVPLDGETLSWLKRQRDSPYGGGAVEWGHRSRGPAQSHASNIIDSIVLSLHGKNGREHAKKSAQADLDDLPLQLAAENLTLRPLFRAFTTWYPNTGVDPPDYFARHATSHAVGQPGVFAPISALVAVMLATSLTVRYSDDLRSAP